MVCHQGGRGLAACQGRNTTDVTKVVGDDYPTDELQRDVERLETSHTSLTNDVTNWRKTAMNEVSKLLG